MKNKYTNKALKKGYQHYNDYKGNQGYIKIVQPVSFKTIIKYLVCFIVIAIIAFYLLT